MQMVAKTSTVTTKKAPKDNAGKPFHPSRHASQSKTTMQGNAASGIAAHGYRQHANANIHQRHQGINSLRHCCPCHKHHSPSIQHVTLQHQDTQTPTTSRETNPAARPTNTMGVIRPRAQRFIITFAAAMYARAVLPSGLVRVRPLVDLFMNVHEEHTGANQTRPPRRTRKTRCAARANPAGDNQSIIVCSRTSNGMTTNPSFCILSVTRTITE